MASAAMRRQGWIELPAALLCLWAAWFHTPLGAITRDVGAHLVGRHGSARPLLSYYSGGEGGGFTPGPGGHPLELPVLRPSAPVTGDLALAFGLRATLQALPPARRRPLIAQLLAQGLPAGASPHALGPPAPLAAALGPRAHRYGSMDAAILALFTGAEPTRYAVERTLASGDRPTLAELARNLPPGFDEQVDLARETLALGTAYGLSWPLQLPVQITSPFGMRLHPVLGEERMHAGVDVRAPRGTPVRAAADGVVRRASSDGVNGRLLIIDHGHGVSTAYCHNERLLVSAGERVRRGQVISLSGESGRTTGPHLHFQVELFGHPVDPLAFRPRSGNALVREGGP